MKSILPIFMALTLSFSAFAEETRAFKKTSSTEATITIKTEETDYVQAAAFVDAQENEEFIKQLLNDENSSLAKLVKEIELKNCEATSTPENKWIDGCGEVTITEAVRTSFGRGGWQSAGAAYTFFVGFTSDGTGRFFDASHTVTILESTEAQTNDNFDYNGTVLKYLALGEIKSFGSVLEN
jgi:hypothetical protein